MTTSNRQKMQNSRSSSRKQKPKKQRGVLGKIIHVLTVLMLTFVIVSVAQVFLCRFIPIPFSAYMAETKIRALVSGENSDIIYSWTPLVKIAPYMPNAVIASEDQQFLDHHGFDFNAIIKAVQYNNSRKAHRTGKKKGASTISQQVAKNMFLWSDRSWARKGFEVWYTMLIEVLWPKKRIMEVYLNVAQTGKKMFGVEAASVTYYGKPAKRLSRAQAAMIAASIPNPVRYKVKSPNGYMYKKQAWILQQMNRLKREGVYMELMHKKS